MWTTAGTARQIAQHARSVTAQGSCRAAYSTPTYTYISTKQSQPVAQALLKLAPWRKEVAPTRATEDTKTTGATKATKDTKTTKATKAPKATKATKATKETKVTKVTKATKATKSEKNPKDLDPEATGDKARVNVASKKLCSDITDYIGPTLERHVGCDILDINPGAGVWSTQLNDVLKPRSHILMEPDAELYKPFLEPLLSRPNTKLVPQSGIMWKELTEAMKHLEHQVQQVNDLSVEPKRNDTLLVTANLCYHPKKRYRNFDSIAVLVLYQLLTSVRFSSLFQKYGLVRMLLWVNDDDKRSVLPRSMQHRKKSAMQAEFACEWMAEVAGKDPASVEHQHELLKKHYARDYGIDLASAKAALARMKEHGIKTPPKRRRMELTQQAMKAIKPGKKTAKKASGEPDLIKVVRPWHAELGALDQAIAAGEVKPGSKEWERRKRLRVQEGRLGRDTAVYADILAELHELRGLQAAGKADSAEFATKEAAYNARIKGLSKNALAEYRLVRDNAHLFEQDPPVLLYDRRPWEPLRVEADEFFPNVECALLDIQPKATSPLMREVGPASQRAGDVFDLIQRAMLSSSIDPVSSIMDRLWPGAQEGILEHCPSLRDPAAGGEPGSGYAELCPRVLNEKQWLEILTAFMKWPFRPTYPELVGRLGDDNDLVGESMDT